MHDFNLFIVVSLIILRKIIKMKSKQNENEMLMRSSPKFLVYISWKKKICIENTDPPNSS